MRQINILNMTINMNRELNLNIHVASHLPYTYFLIIIYLILMSVNFLGSRRP